MDEPIQSRREADVQSRSEAIDRNLQARNAEREKAIKALSAEIMDAYGLCRPLGRDTGSADRG